jgi:hypothetical protein
MRRLLILLVLGVAAAPAAAGSYYPGTVRDGYTFNNGYWYRGSTPHYAHANTGYYNVPYYNNYGGYYYVQQPYTYYTYEQGRAQAWPTHPLDRPPTPQRPRATPCTATPIRA